MQQNLMLPELASMPVEARRQILRDHADTTEQTKYQKPLTPEMLDLKREQLTDNAIKLSEHEDEKKEAMKVFKDKMDPLTAENKVLLTQIKTRQETVEGTLYHIANHESGFMETYDEEGLFVGSRRLKPDEKQGKMFPLSKAQ